MKSGLPRSLQRALQRALHRTLLAILFTAPLASLAAHAQTSLTVQKPWIRYLLPSIPAAGYMVLLNSSASGIVITGASSPACGMLMLHQSKTSSGMAMMMDVPSLTIPAHGSVTFAPGGYHLMCTQPVMKPGMNIPITLSLQNGASFNISMPVYGAQNSP